MPSEKGYAKSKRTRSKSASQGALFCWALIKGGVLCCLFLLDGDFTFSLRSGTPVYAGVYLVFYFAAVLLYFLLQRSDPGFLASEEHSTLLEDGELRRRSKDSDSSHGIEMRHRAATGPPKAEPHLTTSVAAALRHDESADMDAGSDSEEIAAADALVDKISQRISSRRGGPAQVENTAAAQGAEDESAAEAEGVKRRAVPQDGLEEITLCVEEAGVSSVDKATAQAPVGPRHCEHCHTKQLLRTKHCYDCGRCVATFDHHCFWIGNCVGEKNHRLFWWYLLCETITVSWACSLASSTFQYTNGPGFLSQWFAVNFLSLCCLMCCLGFLLMLGGLLFFHTYIIYTGQTTWEVTRPKSISYMRGVPKDIYPFSEGGCANIRAVCCRPLNAQPRIWPPPESPFKETQRFWWIENDYWSCF